jgi:rubrerythrin
VTRRELVAAAAGGALLARPARAAAQVAREADTLTGALELEHATVLAYDRVAAAGVLRGPQRRVAARLRDHEARHADALGRALRELGRRPPAPPRAPAEVEIPAVRAALDALRDRDDALRLLADLERVSLDAYRTAMGRLRDARHLQLAATILAAEAAHLVSWRTVG